ncbi:MAG: YgaP family membrane protein [Mangrovicoccus sp.]
MTANIGKIDRLARLVLGVVLIILAATGTVSGVAMIAALVVGIVMIATAGMRFCLLYRLLGVNTCQL